MFFIITIDGPVKYEESIELWNEIKEYEVNLLHCFNKSYVYGDVKSIDIMKDIVFIVSLKGYPITFERGTVYEQSK